MPNPGALNFPLPSGDDFLIRRQRDLERAAEEQAAARTLARSQIGDGGTLQVDGSINVDGSLTVNGTLSVPAGSLNTAGSINAGDDLTAGDDITAGGDITGATVTATGNVGGATMTSVGAVSGATGSFPAGLSCLNARTNVLVSGYAGAWIDSTGQFGISPSSIRYKMDVRAWQTDITRLLNLRAVTFRYRAAIDADPKRARQLGFIAEEVIQAGFPEFVFYDEEGEVQGLNYDRMVVALLVLAQWKHDTNEQHHMAENERLTTIEQRLTDAGF